MEPLPFYVYLVFAGAVLFAVLLFYKAAHNSKSFLILILSWIALQSILSLSGFYQATHTTLPRFPLLVLPPLILIIVLFSTKKGRAFIDSLDVKLLTLLHTVRILVEITLFWLFVYKAVPQLITFEGRNWDVLSGLSAPFIYYFGMVQKKVSRSILLAWNIACLALLLNVVFYAVLSAPTPFQQFAFDQPNIAIIHFPFVLLPACLVPLVLFSHLATLRQLVVYKNGAINS